MTSIAGSPPDGPVLAVNAAEGRVQIVVADAGGLLGSVELSAPGRTNEHMAPAVAELLKHLGTTVADLSGVACVRGPGSFTGLRMALAFCLGLARPASLPMAGLDYLPLLAKGPGGLLGGMAAVWVRSRNRQVYTQHFSAPDMAPLNNPKALAVEDAALLLAAEAAARPGPVAVMGSGAHADPAETARLSAEAGLSGVVLPDPCWNNPLPDILARAAWSASFSARPPEPLYLRLSDAEENLAAIAKTRGLDPDEAAARLSRATSGISGSR